MEEKLFILPSAPLVCYALDPKHGCYSTGVGGFLCGCEPCLAAQGLELRFDELRRRWDVLPAGSLRKVAKPEGAGMLAPDLERRLVGLLDKLKREAKIR